MAKDHDEEREHRIHYEIIVDAYDEYEQAMSWYIHTNDNLEFPMQAKVKLRLRGGKTEEKAESSTTVFELVEELRKYI